MPTSSSSSSTARRHRKPPTRREAARNRKVAQGKVKPAKPPKAPRIGRRRGPRIAVGIVLLALLAAPAGVLAWYARDAQGRLAAGTTIGGVDVGGLSAKAAVDRLRAQIETPARRAATVTVDGHPGGTLQAADAGVRLNIRSAVRRALARAQEGSFISRGWRELTGAKLSASEDVRVRVDRSAVQRFVDGLSKRVERPARAARLRLSVHSVDVTKSRDGRRLADPAALTGRLVAALRDPGSDRDVAARTAVVKAPVSSTSIWNQHPVVVTVSQDEKEVHVFDRGRLAKTYQVAVGMQQYPTPDGTFSIQSMQKNPVWNVPNSPWAGDLAGKTIPGGSPQNPLKARFIGFNGAVGFHGTTELGSLGTAASHGCIRMTPPDVIDLFNRVSLGTTVFVA